jgi:hypothetical protein
VINFTSGGTSKRLSFAQGPGGFVAGLELDFTENDCQIGQTDMKKIAFIWLTGAFAFSSISAFGQGGPAMTGSGHSHSWVPWTIIGCATGVVSAAAAKNWKRHKELNEQEAWTCGLLYWWNEATGKYERRR